MDNQNQRESEQKLEDRYTILGISGLGIGNINGGNLAGQTCQRQLDQFYSIYAQYFQTTIGLPFPQTLLPAP